MGVSVVILNMERVRTRRGRADVEREVVVELVKGGKIIDVCAHTATIVPRHQ